MWKYVCNYCKEIIEDDEQSLWGHIQLEHGKIFKDIQDLETPYMLEECYEKVKEGD